MKAVALRRHRPLFIFAICVVALMWVVERQHYSKDASTALEIFGATVLGAAILRNYSGPASFNAGLPRIAGIIVAIALAAVFLLLVFAVVVRMRQ